MTSPFTYDFGYSWSVTWIHSIPLVLGTAVAILGVWLGWRRSIVVIASVIALWALTGVFIMHGVFGINAPMRLPSEQFLASNRGHFLDVGAGSGRATIGVLRVRPNTTATAIDIYTGFHGIDDNTPERLMTNARIGGVAERIDVRTADMRKLPFPDGTYDGAVSTYAIDHLRRDDVPIALNEVARVLKPNGEFLLGIVNQDFWVRLSLPIPHFGLAAHRPADPNRWRALLNDSGFDVVEEGTSPATLYWIARKRTEEVSQNESATSR
jgi:SAM-dependent methyltransferase